MFFHNFPPKNLKKQKKWPKLDVNQIFYRGRKMKLKRLLLITVGSTMVFSAYAGVTLHDQGHSSDRMNTVSNTIPTVNNMPVLKQTHRQKVAPISNARPRHDAHAVSPYNEASDMLSRIKFNGFMSAGFAKSTSASKYSVPGHGQVNHKPNFSLLSLAGLQAQAKINSQFTAIMQLVMDGDNTNGNNAYRAKAESVYLRYQFNKRLKVFAGRFRIPLFLYSNTLEVGYNYPWTTLPNEVYRIVPFYDMNGVEAIYSQALGNSDWSVNVQPFLGENTSKFDYYNVGSLGNTVTTNFDENALFGAVVSVSNPYATLRASYGQTSLTATPAGSTTATIKDKTIGFYSFGARMDYYNVLFAAEYAYRGSDSKNDLASLTGYYGMIGYEYRKFLPNFTYAKLKTNNTVALVAGGNRYQVEDQKSMTAGLDYYLNSHIVAKASVSRITPQKGSNGLFDSNPNGSVMLYSLGVNATF